MSGFRLDRGDRMMIASFSAEKLAEFGHLFNQYGIAAIAGFKLGHQKPVADGARFEDNAAIKALACARRVMMPSLAEDGGLVVEALDGAPGVQSAQWVSESGDPVEAMARVQAAIEASPSRSRRAHMVSVMCVALPDKTTHLFRGEVAGTLVWPPRGNQGSGFDAMFMPDGQERTFGEMTADERRGPSRGTVGLSHRARAFARFAAECLE